jgi:hypothetical protein
VSTLGRTEFDEITADPEFMHASWLCTDDLADQLVDAYDQWFPVFVAATPQSCRAVPPVAVPYAPHPVQFDGALIAGAEDESYDVIVVGEPYTLRGRVAGKYRKRQRDWVWFESILTDSAGRDVHKHRYLVTLSALDDAAQAGRVLATRDVTAADAKSLDAYPYEPPPIVHRVAADWERSEPFTDSAYVHSQTALGSQLVPEPYKFTWQKCRDSAEILWVRVNGAPAHMAAYNIHTNPSAARDVGLEQPNVSGIQLQARVHTLMMRALGVAWLNGGRLSCRFLGPVGIEDLVTARGRLVRAEQEHHGTRLTFDVSLKNQAGKLVLVGTCSGIAKEA